MKLFKHLIAIILLLIFSVQTLANEKAKFEIFMGDSPYAKFTISYKDYDAILNTFVLPMGKSSRAKAKKTKARVGTRLKNNISRLTSLEGNRFLFESFRDPQYQQLITDIRHSLASLPDTKPLSEFSKKEQLAYWLNLYNVTVIDELIKIYPTKRLKDIFEEDSFLNQEILEVQGVKLSLNDIQYSILAKKYNRDPLIIYGLYQGIIGGPNIINRAYTAKNVYEELERNAVNFINSNRGTYGNNKKAFRVSSLYERNEVFFPNFDDDLRAHLLGHIEGFTRHQLQDATRIRANIDDWNITDVYGTERTYGGGVSTNEAALLDPYGGPEITGEQLHFDGQVLTSRPSGPRAGGDAGNAGFHNMANLSMTELAGKQGRFSFEQLELLRKLNTLRLEHSGLVTITDIAEDGEPINSESKSN